MIELTDHGTLIDDGREFVRVELVDGDPAGLEVLGVEAERRLPRLVGPTVLLLVRHLVRHVDEHVEPSDPSIDAIGMYLGVPPSKVRSAIKRAHRYGLVSHEPSEGKVVVRRRWRDRMERA